MLLNGLLLLVAAGSVAYIAREVTRPSASLNPGYAAASSPFTP